MRIPFLQKPSVKKITGDAYGIERYEAESLINKLLQDFPELLAVTVVDIKSGRMLAAYTSLASFDPYKLSPRDAEVVKQLQKGMNAPWLAGQEISDLIIILEDQMHITRPLAGGKWFCSLAVHTADTNLAILRDVMRRHTTE